jgi:paraquat-inducible protein B
MEGGAGPTQETLRKAIGEGLRAQLATDSILTGVMHVSLSVEPGSEVHLHDPIEGVLEIPTIPPPLEEVGAAVRNLVDRVTRLDLEAVFGSLQRALDGIAALTGGPEARNALTSLDHVLVDLDELIRGMQPLSKELLTLVQRADALRSELESGVGSARETLESVDTLANELASTLPPLLTSLARAFDRLDGATAALQSTLESAHALVDPDAPIAVELQTNLRELADTLRSARAVFELIERDPAVILRGRGEDGGR